jgi:hypothetical protein
MFADAGAVPPPDTNFSRINQIELAVCRDPSLSPSSWTRAADRAVFLGVQPYDGESYETNQLLPAGAPVVRDDLGGEIWSYTNGARFGGFSFGDHLKYDHGKELFRLGIGAEDFEAGTALCLSKLRPEGFCSLEAGVQGTLLTKPFIWEPGKVLYLNVDARHGKQAFPVYTPSKLSIHP